MHLTDFWSEELNKHFNHRVFSISQLFTTYFQRRLPKIAESPHSQDLVPQKFWLMPFWRPIAHLLLYSCELWLLCHLCSDTNHRTKRLSTADQWAAWKMTHEWLQPVRNNMYLWAGVLCKRRKPRNRIRNVIKRDDMRWKVMVKTSGRLMYTVSPTLLYRPISAIF